MRAWLSGLAGCSSSGASSAEPVFSSRRSSLWRRRGDEAGGAKEDDGVLDALAAEAAEGFLVLGDNADETAVGGVEEVGVLVGEARAFVVIVGIFRLWFSHVLRLSTIFTRYKLSCIGRWVKQATLI